MTQQDRMRAEKQRMADEIGQAMRNVVKAYGDPVVVQTTRHVYDQRYAVSLLQWQPHGIAKSGEVHIKLPADIATPSVLANMIESKFSGMLRHHQELAKIHGVPRNKDVSEIDAEEFRIEKPLAILLRHLYQEGSRKRILQAMVDERLRTLSSVEDEWNPDQHSAIKIGRPWEETCVKVEIIRNVLRAKFRLWDRRHDFTWSKGSIKIKGMEPPELVLGRMAEMRGNVLGDVLRHPWFDPDMVMTDITHHRRSDGLNIFLSVKNDTVPLNKAIPA